MFLFLSFFSLLPHLSEASQATAAHACPGRDSYFLLSRGYLLITIVLSTSLHSLISLMNAIITQSFTEGCYHSP